MAKDDEEPSPVEVAPLVSLSCDLWNQPLSEDNSAAEEHEKVGQAVVQALQTSGFLLVESDLMPASLQAQALEDATKWLTTKDDDDEMVIAHPTDPKTYVMLESKHLADDDNNNSIPRFTPTLHQYWQACEDLKKNVLRAVGVGLRLPNPEDLATWHQEGTHSALRLLHYPPASPTTGNRCKEHSDYGTVTLLTTSGVSGLEIYLQGKWWPVPYVEGTVVVNIGSLLSEWTRQEAPNTTTTTTPLLATLHRVAGPASQNGARRRVLPVSAARTSLAFFADPDEGSPLSSSTKTTMEEYIRWRSGGSRNDRSGVAFTDQEKELLASAPDKKDEYKS